MCIVLASKSKRRQQLIKMIGLPFRIIEIDVNESYHPGLLPEQVAKSLALRKVEHAFSQNKIEENELVISSDTIVVMGEKILNKPACIEEAIDMLNLLQGRTHHVITGFSIKSNMRTLTDFDKTSVTFAKISPNEIRDYVIQEKPLDKAGGYGIQDERFARFIFGIKGCFYNVVGLPLAKIHRTLNTFFL